MLMIPVPLPDVMELSQPPERMLTDAVPAVWVYVPVLPAVMPSLT